MVTPKVGFIVYGVHKDGLKDPMGRRSSTRRSSPQSKTRPARGGARAGRARHGGRHQGEARECFDALKKTTTLDGVVLFSGTWVWAAHMIAAIRDFA